MRKKSGKAAALVRRIISGEIDKAIIHLENIEKDSNEAIHQARKSFKKVRAVLRLVRDEIGEDIYKKENIFFRDLGREIAFVRDGFILYETLDKLTGLYAGYLYKNTFGSVKKQLLSQHENNLENILSKKKIINDMIINLNAAKLRADSLPINNKGFKVFYGGLKRVYSKGKDAMQKAAANPSDENYHEWRKKVKYLWHNLETFNSCEPDVMNALINAAKNLSDLLGESHDYVVLKKYILLNDMIRDETVMGLFTALADHQINMLNNKAAIAGEGIYHEKPKAFTEKIESYCLDTF